MTDSEHGVITVGDLLVPVTVYPAREADVVPLPADAEPWEQVLDHSGYRVVEPDAAPPSGNPLFRR